MAVGLIITTTKKSSLSLTVHTVTLINLNSTHTSAVAREKGPGPNRDSFMVAHMSDRRHGTCIVTSLAWTQPARGVLRSLLLLQDLRKEDVKKAHSASPPVGIVPLVTEW